MLINRETLDNKIIEGKTINDFEMVKNDWEKILREPNEMLEFETLEREKEIEKLEKKKYRGKECETNITSAQST